jgi:pyochelin biosynthetic protein PchC
MRAATRTWLRLLGDCAHPRVRLVCFPHAGGSSSFFRPWRQRLSPDVELYGVQYPGRLDRIGEPCVADMPSMVRALTEAVEPLLDLPVVLFGHSLGGVVAYEVARWLPEHAGRAPDWLFVSGRPAPHRQRPAAVHLGSDDDLWQQIAGLGGTRTEVLSNAQLREALLPALRGDYRLSECYEHESGPALDCPLWVVLGDRDSEVSVAEAEDWAGYAGPGFSVRVVPGDHFYHAAAVPEPVEAVLGRLRHPAREAGP